MCANVNKRRLFINGYTERCAIGTPQKAVEDTRETNTKNIYDTVPWDTAQTNFKIANKSTRDESTKRWREKNVEWKQ